MTSSTIIWWCLLATLLFWSVGAYNRLVRLRSQASRTFAAIALQLPRYAEIIAAAQTLDTPSDSPSVEKASDQGWAGLLGALQQLTATLAMARDRPLQAPAIRALTAADEVVQNAWLRVCADGHSQDGAPLPASLLLQWQDAEQQVQHARIAFSEAVHSYNAAIAQFPARLLAWLFGFRMAQAF
ncbi:MAG: LemA family protein [Burkholderiales bacterium]|nr:LemA family protein [Burkholderiales bacterium]